MPEPTTPAETTTAVTPPPPPPIPVAKPPVPVPTGTTPTTPSNPKPRLLLKNFPHIPDGYADEVSQEELDQLKANRPDLYEEFQDVVDRFEHPEKYTREALDAAAKESVDAEVGGTN